MILKTISIKALSGVGNSIRYILKPEKMVPKKAIGKLKKDDRNKIVTYYHGVPITERDLQNLESEKVDAMLLKQMEAFNGTKEQFIQKLISESGKERDVNEKEPEVGEAVIIKHNLKGNTEKEFIKQFKENEKNRMNTRTNQKFAEHAIMSFSNQDLANIDDRMLQDLANQFLELRCRGNLAIAAIHKNTESSHIHFIVSGTQLNGRSSRVSKAEFQNIKEQLQEYQKERYPQLNKSVVEHGKSKVKGKDYLKNFKNSERSTVKNNLLKCIESSMLKAKTTDDFYKSLKSFGFDTYQRAGRITGIKTEDGMKFRLSRLNVSEKLKALDLKKEQEEKSLKELRDLRSGRSKAVDRELKNDKAKSTVNGKGDSKEREIEWNDESSHER